MNVAADGTLTFTGLTDQTTYFAWAAGTGAPVRFTTRHDYADDLLSGVGNTSSVLTQNRVTANVASRAEPSGRSATSNGTDTGQNSRVSHLSSEALDDFEIAFPNYGFTSDGANAITVTASVEYPSGTYTPVTFNGGATSVSIPVGGVVWCDPVSVPIPANTQFWTRSFVSATGTWRRGKPPQATFGEAASSSNGETDRTATTVTGTAVDMYQPAAIRARVAPTRPRVLSIGDSINWGSSNSGQSASPKGGYTEQIFAGVVPFQRVAIHGQKAQDLALNSSQWRRRLQLARGCTHVYCTLGINDVTGGRTLAQIQPDLITIWTRFKLQGMKVFQSTLTPVSTSTDSFATLSPNQTTHATNSVRVALNAWLRAGSPMSGGVAVAVGTGGAILAGQTGHPLAAASGANIPASMALGYVEVADTVESARDSGLFIVNGSANGFTSDGTHPRDNTYDVMAAALATVPNGFVVT